MQGQQAIYVTTTGKYGFYINSSTQDLASFKYDGTRVLGVIKGCLLLKEEANPTNLADYGTIYTQSDNKLYFIDGAGNTHEIAFV